MFLWICVYAGHIYELFEIIWVLIANNDGKSGNYGLLELVLKHNLEFSVTLSEHKEMFGSKYYLHMDSLFKFTFKRK